MLWATRDILLPQQRGAPLRGAKGRWPQGHIAQLPRASVSLPLRRHNPCWAGVPGSRSPLHRAPFHANPGLALPLADSRVGFHCVSSVISPEAEPLGGKPGQEQSQHLVHGGSTCPKMGTWVRGQPSQGQLAALGRGQAPPVPLRQGRGRPRSLSRCRSCLPQARPCPPKPSALLGTVPPSRALLPNHLGEAAHLASHLPTTPGNFTRRGSPRTGLLLAAQRFTQQGGGGFQRVGFLRYSLVGCSQYRSQA